MADEVERLKSTSDMVNFLHYGFCFVCVCRRMRDTHFRPRSIVDCNFTSIWQSYLKFSLQVFIYGGVGPLPSDLTVAGVAKAFGVRMVYLVINDLSMLITYELIGLIKLVLYLTL